MEMGTNYKNLESGQTYVDIGTLTEGWTIGIGFVDT